VNRPVLLLALLGLLAAPLSYAEEPSVCTSMCTSEKEQCTVRAAKLTELDKEPKLEEKNPFARTGDVGQVWSESARVNERRAAQRRNSERVEVCNASYKRCTRACAPTPPAGEQAAAVKTD
jgi:hypothetical protein